MATANSMKPSVMKCGPRCVSDSVDAAAGVDPVEAVPAQDAVDKVADPAVAVAADVAVEVARVLQHQRVAERS